jgi:hypothetical protein
MRMMLAFGRLPIHLSSPPRCLLPTVQGRTAAHTTGSEAAIGPRQVTAVGGLPAPVDARSSSRSVNQPAACSVERQSGDRDHHKQERRGGAEQTLVQAGHLPQVRRAIQQRGSPAVGISCRRPRTTLGRFSVSGGGLARIWLVGPEQPLRKIALAWAGPASAGRRLPPASAGGCQERS